MTNIYLLLHYLTRLFILFVFSIIMIATYTASIGIQLVVIVLILIYFSVQNYQIENILFDFQDESLINNKVLKILGILAKIAINFIYLYLFLMGLQVVVMIIFTIDYIAKIVFGISIEELLTNQKIISKEQDASKV